MFAYRESCCGCEEDFLDGGESVAGFDKSVVSKGGESGFFEHGSYFMDEESGSDCFEYGLRGDEEFEYSHSSAVSRVSAFVATDTLHEGWCFADDCLNDLAISLIGFVLLLAMVANFSDEALRESGTEDGGDEVGFDAEVHQSGDGAGCVIGVKGAEHKVPGECGLGYDSCGFPVSYFADHENVGILPEKRSQGGGECKSGFFVDLELVDSVERRFDGVFDGTDIDFR